MRTARHSTVSTHSSRRKRAALFAIVYAGAGAVLLLLIVGVAQLRELAADNAHSIQLIESCTTEGGSCATASRQRNADTIRVLNEFTTYVVACADQPGTQSAARIRACATQKMREAHSHE